jgi:Kef-type K+ transport system membrane component KefB
MVEYLNSLTMYVFIPFFTSVGLQLNLPVLIKAMGFSITASLVRAFCMMCGTYTGGVHVGLAKDKALRLWMGLIPQAGVALGLAGIVGHQFKDTFGYAFQSTVLGKHPTFCRHHCAFCCVLTNVYGTS